MNENKSKNSINVYNENSRIPMEKSIDNENSFETLKKSLLSIAVEAWRFSRVYERLISKLDAGEQKRFFSQFRYFQKQLEDNLLDAGYRLQNLEGQVFDTGIAATAVNQSDFLTKDVLVVDQMLEPVILNENGIVKMGKVFLRKVERT